MGSYGEKAKTTRFADFELPLWIEGNAKGMTVSLAGSLAPSITVAKLKAISSDPEATSAALKIENVKLGDATGAAGGKELRQQVINLYDQSKVKVTTEDVIIANGTTGANNLVLQGLISPGDHVVCMYPAYGQFLEVPKLLGAELSNWRLDAQNDWEASLDDLEALLKPNTRMLIVNNPHNPTGSVLSSAKQADIIKLAAKYNIIVFCDEIFRPLFHTDEIPTSMVETTAYDRVIVTGSLSKAYGSSGVRIGWIVTRNRELRELMMGLRQWTLMYVSVLDEVVAREVLGERCRDSIVSNILEIAAKNLAVLRSFVQDNQETVSCSIPKGSSIGFIKFSDPRTRKPVDDVQFCRILKQETGLLMSPGSLCFGPAREGDFVGYVRIHITASPEQFREGIDKLSMFLASSSFAQLSVS